MMTTIPLERVNQFTLNKHHLAKGKRSSDLVQVAEDVVGLHATNSTTPYLSLFARMQPFRKEMLDEALYVEHRVGKIRCVRNTIYIHTKEWLPVFHAATSRRVEALSRRYLEYRGVTEGQYNAMAEKILSMLVGKGMTATEIRKELSTDLDISAVLYLMCDQGLLVRGEPVSGWKDKRVRYTRFRDYFPDLELGREVEAQAMVAVVKQYLRSFGPVSKEDIEWWTGFGRKNVRWALEQIEAEIVALSVEGIDLYYTLLRSDLEGLIAMDLSDVPIVNILPSLDSYLMGFKKRERYLDNENADLVFDRSGNATSAILVDGKVVGVWDFQDQTTPVIKVFLFEDVNRNVRDMIHAEAFRTGRFIADREVELKVCETMKPLPDRPAGSVMAPLKDC
jgi:hypothetical protein